MCCALLLSAASSWTYSGESVAMNTNTFLISSLSFILMLTLILFYFLSSMSILTAEKTPMRTITCHQNLIL